ncbi:MAG TPA: Smr/MutS family protein [bacterium]|nr:Smr/MutS family protein [bacterium]
MQDTPWRPRPGAWVRVAPLGLVGEVGAEHADGWEIVTDGLRVICPAAELSPVTPPDPVIPVAPRVRVHWRSAAAVQLDLHGLTVDAARPVAETFLNRAFLDGAGLVRLVHGKGSGALQRWLDEYLGEHPLVAAFRRGWYGEGDTGVTIVTLQPRKGQHETH